jgi:acyl-CoA reductase-like NAD-dependent aldehyde dehydrogenase
MDVSALAKLKTQAVQEHGKPLMDRDGVPLFLLDLPNCSDFQQEELPAPVFPIITVKYQHEIAKWLNNTSYGNLATIWGDHDKALKIAEKLEVGAIWLNHWMRPQDESPWGIKQSAFGIHENRATGSFFSDRKLTL